MKVVIFPEKEMDLILPIVNVIKLTAQQRSME
jgi:hypothetical protein